MNLFEDEFLDITSKAGSMKEKKNEKLELFIIKNFSSANDTIKEIKRQARNCKKSLARPVSDQGLVGKIY